MHILGHAVEILLPAHAYDGELFSMRQTSSAVQSFLKSVSAGYKTEDDLCACKMIGLILFS